MEASKISGGQELLCVNVSKVYDWITNQANVNLVGIGLTFPVGATDPCAVGNTITDVVCDLTVVSVSEIGARVERIFIIDGAEVTLERVTVLKTLSITVTVSGLTAAGVPFVVTSVAIPSTITESFFLCAPEGTEVVVSVSDIECAVSGSCIAGVFTADISAILCQSIQVTADVTIELTADFCQPRDNIISSCPAPVIPPQCPTLFPPMGA